MEWDYEEIQRALQKQAEEGLTAAQNTLDGVVPEDAPAFPEE
jgi:hypothetical protein